MGKLIISGKDVADVDQLVNWKQSGWDATIPKCVMAENITEGLPCGPAFSPNAKNHGLTRFSRRPALRMYPQTQLPPLEAVQSVVKQFVLHHDGLAYAAETFHVLQNERGLSCHFIIDNDGTIYQTLDLAWCAFHASEYNPISIGVEICNRGNWDAPIGNDGKYYDIARSHHPDKKFPPRKEAWAVAHGSRIHCFDFTDEQYNSMHNLAHALTKALPNIALDYPQDVPGHVNRTLINPIGNGNGNAWGFSGYLGHFHLTTRKWDPGPFDFKGFIDKLRGALCFPVWTGKPDDKPGAKPQIPESEDELERQIGLLYTANEERAQAGYFPVGPWGDSRLWHGGVHIPDTGPANTPGPVFAPFPGRIVLARMSADSAIGSNNFVLIRHDMTVGPERLRFFSLYMHLADDTKSATPPAWMSKDGWTKPNKGDADCVLMDEPIEAGAILGHFGVAGPPDDQKRQIHFEIFSKEPLVDEKTSKWVIRDGSGGGRFCEIPDILDPIDTAPKDGMLSKAELDEFFSGGERQSLRNLVVYSLSEWTTDPEWGESLRTPEDFRNIEPAQIDQLVEEQITPGLWWTDDNALFAHLPRDGYVYHYHPLTFVQWINEQMLEASSAPPDDAGATTTTTTAAGLSSDFDDDARKGDDSDMFSGTEDSNTSGDNDLYDIGNMIEGYDGDPEAQ